MGALVQKWYLSSTNFDLSSPNAIMRMVRIIVLTYSRVLRMIRKIEFFVNFSPKKILTF
jgi:hypothetical protein